MAVPILAGAAAFLVLVLSDYAESRLLSGLRLASTILAAGLLGYGILGCALFPWRAGIAVAPRAAAGVVGTVFLFLLIRSLFLEIRRGRKETPNGRELVTTGTYALVRHPGVLWFLFFLLGLAVALDSRVLLIATPIWTGLDLAYAAIQDRLFFPRLFGNAYRDYRMVTPFIIPSPRSLRHCYETWDGPFGRSTSRQGDHYGNGA